MKDKALELLKKNTANNTPRQNRSLDLLKQPEKDSEGWFMNVPSCFNGALDIRQTERVVKGKKSLDWTQGAFFSFKSGDTIYDTPEAYKVWSEALKQIKVCLTVKNATSAGNNESDNIRYPGSVTFAILKPDKQRTKLIEQEQRTLSQDEFVKFLITGNMAEEIDSKDE